MRDSEYIAPLSPSLEAVASVLEMIKFSHSLFALPFALAAMVVAAGGWPSWPVLIWIVVACVAARSMAMAYNRLVDRHIDKRNPRTKDRHLPAGKVSVSFAVGFTALSAIIFVIAAFALNPLCLVLSPVAIAILMGYSHTKRFTQGSHLFLGLALSVAPAGAWIAVRGSMAGLPIFLCGAVLFWTAGFDIIYACLDVEFDRREHLFSVPAHFGIARALQISAILHLLSMAGFVIFVYRNDLNWIAWAGLLIIAVLLFFEHRIVRPDDLSKVGPAFFTFNALVSAVFFFGCLLALPG
ncbi:MAG: 4-hydroxybenzoate octaprenyltransferase [Candidatus Sumerlaeia bacterium]